MTVFLIWYGNLAVLNEIKMHKHRTYPENKDSWKLVAISASLHIYNVRTKGAQHKPMVKSIADGYTSWLIHSIANY